VPPESPTRLARQAAFDELEDPLSQVTFVVVDLETTGGSARTELITEIGAVKVRGGEVLGEFATLVDPGRSIPPQIVMLTGITDAMVANAPRIESVLGSFLEFARGSVLVAHNAGFDVGFLKAACARMGVPWPRFPVVDTVRLARRTLSRDEAPSVRLGLLAPLLGATVTPDHRALHDARATVDVLHALLERLGPLGVLTLTELRAASRDVDPARRRKRRLAAGLPSRPGVYLFRGSSDEVLYVGTSKNLRQRVRSYFTAAEVRGRVREMVRHAERVDHVVCATVLEAKVREQRLIAAHQPRYNRRSRQPGKVYWICLTDEAFPRLAVVRTVTDRRGVLLGPFTSLDAARTAVDALQSAVPIRRCTQRIRRTAPSGTPCALAELGRCGAPCSGAESAETYSTHVVRIAELIEGSSDEVLATLASRLDRLATSGRFAEAAASRDRLATLIEGLARLQRLGALTRIAELVAARPDGDGGWEFAVIRHGRLAAAGVAPRGVDAMATVDLLVASAESVAPGPGPLPAASAEETATVLAWLERPGTRLVRSTDGWTGPAAGAGGWHRFAAAAAAARSLLSEKDLLVRRGPDLPWSEVVDDRSNWRGRTSHQSSRGAAG
jgi:DNA polymerase-3 subunit epsilon